MNKVKNTYIIILIIFGLAAYVICSELFFLYSNNMVNIEYCVYNHTLTIDTNIICFKNIWILWILLISVIVCIVKIGYDIKYIITLNNMVNTKK